MYVFVPHTHIAAVYTRRQVSVIDEGKTLRVFQSNKTNGLIMCEKKVKIQFDFISIIA